MDSLFDKDNNKFFPENPDGNIEYKWRLDTKNELGYKKLISQMMWRINEGYELYGEKRASYLIGVYDNGNLGELSVDKLVDSINIFKDIIKKIDVKIEKEEIKQINNSYIYFVTIIKKDDELIINEKHVIVIGESQSGKTTLISQLCYESNIKNYVLKHVHEKITGSTTDIKKEIIGIKNNRIINYSDYGGWDQITEHSDTIINIYDIPVINIKVIMTYLLGINPDYIIICYKNNMDNIKFYIDYCNFYNIKYKIINFYQIINFNKEYFNNMLLDITKYTKENNKLIDPTTSLFRIIDYYDIPDKGCILSGIQISNKFSNEQKAILISGQNKYDIIIKSIYKKTIKCFNINLNESGSFNIESNSKLKITKNAYIVNKINKINKTYRFVSNIKINDGQYNVIIFNGNMIYNTNIEIKDNTFTLESDILINDNKLVMTIDNLEFNNLIMCTIDL